MQVTDEMVDAGLRITLSSVGLPAGECLHATDVREILIASLSNKQAGEVKALEWRQHIRNGSYLAHGVGILYAVDEDHECAVLAKYEGSSVTKSAHPHAEAAKAAAQADYEQRIRAALVDVPAVEPVAWMDDGTCRAGSDSSAHRVVTDAQKRDMPEAIASSFTTPLFASPPLSHRGEDSAEVLRSALQRISELTHSRANAKDARDLHLTVKAIADAALAATRSGSATSAKGSE